MIPLPRTSITTSPAPRVAIPEAPEPQVTFVIVTYGTGPIVVDTIVSIAETGAGIPYEVVVVDNPHPGHGARALTELLLDTAGVRVVQPTTNVGFGGGCELGALHAEAPVIAFLNPDVTLTAGWLAPLLDALGSEPATSIVAPVLLDPDGGIQEAGQSLDRNGETTPILTDADDGLVAVDYASAACWLMRRDEHERLGGFDPAYHPAYFEDVDLALRARSLGGTCAVHTGVRIVHHRGSGSAGRATPAFAQRDQLLATWPAIRWRAQPPLS